MSRPPDPLTEFRVPVGYLAPYLDGVYLAVNALPGAYLVYDAHNCGYHKAERIAGSHDLFSDLVRWDQTNRVVRTDLDTREYVMGSEDRLSMKLLQVAERYRPELIFVARSSVVVFGGHDARPVVDELSAKLDVPIILLPDGSSARDYVSGYLDTVAALAAQLSFTGEGERGVCIAGYVFDRNEGDHQGNVAELGRMLRALEVPVGPVLLGGQSPATLRAAAPPRAVIDVAPSWNGGRQLATRIGAIHHRTSLPVGIEGSAAWVREVGEVLDATAAAARFVDQELGALVPQLEWILPRAFLGRAAMVFADRIWLDPLAAFLTELGMRVTGVGNTSGDFASAGAASPATGADLQQAPELTEQLRDFVAAARARGELDLIIGTSFTRRLVADLGVPFVELGFPSVTHHVLRPAPFIGFDGVRVLVERMLEALELGALVGETPD